MRVLYEGGITKVQGLLVGQAEGDMTGVTVVLCEGDGAVVAADVRGAAPGTRETDLCRPENTVEKANAIVLSGGSAYGLDSAGGVMRYLEEHGFGVDMGVCKVPIVPAAVIFDLMVGDAHIRPDAEMGYAACEAARMDVRQGAHGAGAGATVGKLIPGAQPQPGGVGTASITLTNGVTIGAIAVVNACGDVYDIHTGEPLACGHMPDGAPVLCDRLLWGGSAGCASANGAGDSISADGASADSASADGMSPSRHSDPLPNGLPGCNTTIAVIATDAALTKAQAQRLAACAHDGFARAIRPVHTQMDGDTVFALATGRMDAEVSQLQLCAAAAEVMGRAVCNAVMAGENP